MTKTELKKLVLKNIDKHAKLLYDLADYIHENPELGESEEKAAAYIKQVLHDHGFTVSAVLPEKFSTAFKGTKGTGKKKIGFLAEYDALPEIGHGCGHNLIAMMSVGAALAVAEEAGELATVHLFGCPAEETIGGKIYMAEAGLFDGLDAALIVHPGDETAIGGTAYATHPLEITFLGKSAHVADPDYHGINALDALVDFYTRFKALETEFTEPHIIGAIITEGGTAANVIPDRATVRTTVRALRVQYLEENMLPNIRMLAETVAKEHGAEVKMNHYEPLFKDMVNDPRLDVYFSENFNDLSEAFSIKADNYASGSTDVGNVSYLTRTSQPEIAIGRNIPGHTAAFAKAAGSNYGKMQGLIGAKAMAMTAIDVLFEKE